ncbi:MAG: aldehyde ferredoxin oxidoreductase family protein [Anaerolineae bacterium]|nr:aldehyde ferredoxin oxidoreductase family protein [Anaerolineae bacterium]
MSRTAFVDLTTGRVTIEQTPEDLERRFIGGRGLGAKLLYDLVGPEVDPFGPENYLIFTAGPLAGTPWPTSARLHVTFKSPLTGIYGYANTGGHFVAELKHAGYDALLVTGRAPQPSLLRVTDDEIVVEPAEELWGRTTGEVHDALLGKDATAGAGRVACIGPAGERGVRIAAIINDRSRAAARGGPGAVMGSKNLKAIHVIARRRPSTPPALRSAAREAIEKLRADPHLDGLRRWGTLVLMDGKNIGGDQPARNHQFAQVPFIQQINAVAFDRYVLEHKGCYACPIKCDRKSRVADGPYAVEIHGPEYETTNALGPMCWVSDPEAILYANHLCNELGLDTISTGVTIAFAMECYENGLLDEPGLPLTFGSADAVHGLIERIAYRRGIGDILAEGTRRAAQIIGRGAERFAMQVKGMELPRQEPRFAKGFGLGHATSNRGADHLYGLPAIDLAGAWDVAQRLFPAEIVPELMDPANEKYKADMVVFGEHFCAVTDALGICKFSTIEEYALFPEDLAPGLAALWGGPLTGADLLTIGERIVNLERMYNVRQGLSRADDRLPERFTREPVPLYEFSEAPDTGELRQSAEPIRYGLIQDFDAMLDRYYRLRGWGRDGVPLPETLQRLGLHECLAG